LAGGIFHAIKAPGLEKVHPAELACTLFVNGKFLKRIAHSLDAVSKPASAVSIATTAISAALVGKRF
jgi:hypothetical protein